MKPKKIVVIAVLILLLGVITLAFVKQMAVMTPLTNPITFQVIMPGWKNTGISLKPNNPVTISAEGSCRWAQESHEQSLGPDGINYWMGNSNFLAPGLPVMSLVAKIGNDAPVFVGSGPVTLEGSGKLYLGFNDDVYSDNSGSFTVNISFISMPENQR